MASPADVDTIVGHSLTGSFHEVVGVPENCERLLQQAFFYEPVPEVRRVIFIATPHRGSPLASTRP